MCIYTPKMHLLTQVTDGWNAGCSAKFPPSLGHSDASSHKSSRNDNSFFLMFQLLRSAPWSTKEER